MKTNIFKFYFYKLILLMIVAICASLLSFFLSSTLPEMENKTIYTVISSGIPMLFFFVFMYSMEVKIKIPETRELVKISYYTVFTLKEASVYLIFLVPFKIAYLISPEFALGKNIFGILYNPHSLLLRLTDSIFVNLIALCVIYAVMAFTAHYLKVKKTFSVS